MACVAHHSWTCASSLVTPQLRSGDRGQTGATRKGVGRHGAVGAVATAGRPRGVSRAQVLGARRPTTRRPTMRFHAARAQPGRCLLGTPKCTRGVALGFVTHHVDHAAFTPFPDPTGQWATELWGLLPPGRLTWNSVSCLWRASCSARALSRVFLSSLSSNSLTGRKGERKPSFSILSSTQTCPSFRTRPPPGSRRGPAACGQPHNPL